MPGREGASGRGRGQACRRAARRAGGTPPGRQDAARQAETPPGGQGRRPAGRQQGRYRMLTARAITSAPTPSDTADWTAIVSLAHRASGITSVGLNAVAFVNDR